MNINFSKNLILKIIWQERTDVKSSSGRVDSEIGSIFAKLGTKLNWVNGIQVCSNEELRQLLRGDN